VLSLLALLVQSYFDSDIATTLTLGCAPQAKGKGKKGKEKKKGKGQLKMSSSDGFYSDM
jgi:hypothetical protein